MPSSTPGGFPYPTPPEAVREGAANIQALATEVDKRLGPQVVLGARNVAAFDQNGLWYGPDWASYGVTFTAQPAVTASVAQTTAGADAGVNVQVYHPHTDVNHVVIQGNYTKDGRTFQGSIDIHLIAIGPGRRI